MEAQRYADESLELALQSSDELCHVVLFDWLWLENGWDDKLLDIQSPYLENYLKRRTTAPIGVNQSMAGSVSQQPVDLVMQVNIIFA